ncbi:hypothetical protein A2116_02190 [Candidatus Jorgensenbacteria bacterium GWA1_49_17]|uniref:Uncharacterized protein n=1 Tax=Candidatus Jorgensenbacteria bacterium GWA1_49_17 TaxID=1798467 RepID=A0A1F6BSX7_9BACT|nr:MAG: hypothetical protein A2116_02190 [Candidatus Jorgensenbacteria bacterium GWA1_49_17]
MKKNHFVLIGLAVVAVTIFYGVSIKPAEPVSLTALTVADGPVSVTVTPIFSDTKWSFNVALDTHSEELNADLTKVLVIVTDDGREYLPINWEGDPPGGHHREGILSFNPIVPQPRFIELILKDIGGVEERGFLWMTS